MTNKPELLREDERGKVAAASSADWIAPMLAVLTEEHFSDPDWIFERKFDGIRLLGYAHDGGVRLMTRNRKERNGHFPECVEALQTAAGRHDFIVDGEVVAFDGELTSFSRLQQRSGIADPDEARASGVRVYLYLFDLLHLDGWDLRRLPLKRRKAILRAGFGFDDPLRYTAHRNEHGKAYLEEACRRGWEGLIAKDGNSEYASKRSGAWLKFKCVNGQELVIVGFTEPQGEREGFGALLVGYYENGDLVYAGKVGTGYSDAFLREFRARLGRLERRTSPLAGGAPREPGVHWVTPTLVAEIGFTEWTHEGRLRHPRFLGLRSDKAAREVVRERP